MTKPVITVVVPSFNQGRFLEDALLSIFAQPIALEVFVLDGGSSDNSVEIIKKYENRLAGWRSHRDRGQSAAINEGIAMGSAPYVCWLNSDDFYYENALSSLYHCLEQLPQQPAAYGKCWTVNVSGAKLIRYLTLPFIPYLFANYCFICQPGTLIRREVWQTLGGLDEDLHMAMDYELWWKIYSQFGRLAYCKQDIAATRAHGDTKTLNNTSLHYKESVKVVEKYWGRAPLKWQLALPLIKLIRRIEKVLIKKNTF